MKYLNRNLIAIDQLFNTIIGGQPDETISAKIYRMKIETNKQHWKILEKIVNGMFFDSKHCEDSFNSEVERKQISHFYNRKNNE
jgi:hypothetical protein